MTCKIFEETGKVPLDCLFGCNRGCVHERSEPRGDARCNRCGSEEVRWRQQTGKWVLFSLQPGVEHVCELKDDFGVVKP